MLCNHLYLVLKHSQFSKINSILIKQEIREEEELRGEKRRKREREWIERRVFDVLGMATS